MSMLLISYCAALGNLSDNTRTERLFFQLCTRAPRYRQAYLALLIPVATSVWNEGGIALLFDPKSMYKREIRK